MNIKTKILLSGLTIMVLIVAYFFQAQEEEVIQKTGSKIDEFNKVSIYYNGRMNHVEGRNVQDGYNIGLKWQCVEFVKRYYYKHYKHKMPNSYGHAKAFFNNTLKDGVLNKQRGLLQFTNPSGSKPQVGDLLIFDGSLSNAYGHVAIISQVEGDEIEIVQQNKMPSRQTYTWSKKNGKYRIEGSRILGWLRKR